jgi:exodeoxyribonuclease V alpha subunit
VTAELRRVIGALAAKRGAATAKRVQVLTPRRTGPLGAVALNVLLQADLNPGGAPGPEIAHAHVVRVGDKVIQRRNDYAACDGGLFNGEQGLVERVDVLADSVTVRFGRAGRERLVTLRGAQLANLELAWAVTVHRAQGSEWPDVVMVYHDVHGALLDHAVLYTGLTRAQQLFVLVGSTSAVRSTCARPPQQSARVTGLRAQCAASGLAVASADPPHHGPTLPDAT